MSWQKDEHFAVKVTELAYQHYQKLPKKGKPQKGKEWTLLAAVVMSRENGKPHYISLLNVMKWILLQELFFYPSKKRKN